MPEVIAIVRENRDSSQKLSGGIYKQGCTGNQLQVPTESHDHQVGLSQNRTVLEPQECGNCIGSDLGLRAKSLGGLYGGLDCMRPIFKHSHSTMIQSHWQQRRLVQKALAV